jgi:hypothetical protein
MPIDPALGSQLADLGGFALFLLLVVTIAVGLWRGWWVPGFIAREWKGERDQARTELAEARKTVNTLTVELARERRRRASDHA